MLKLNNIITLREHQTDGLATYESKVAAGETRGRFVLPTGAGKSILQANISLVASNNGAKLIFIGAPTISLCHQLAGDFNFAIDGKFNTINFNSGEVKEELFSSWSNYLGTTTDAGVAVEAARKAGGTTIIFCCYASMPELVGVKFDLAMADEAQKLVGASRFETWSNIDATVKLTFTATERHNMTGTGLNNVNVFGKRWFVRDAAEMIAKGYIVAPELHVVSYYTDADSKGNTDDSTVSQMVAAAKKQVESGLATIGSSKILFATKGSAHVKLVNDSIATFKKHYADHKVFTCTSKTGFRVDNVKMSRQKWFAALKACDNALVFHYNMLAEGIDVDGLTGVVIMRNLAEDTLQQTIGRAVRLFKADPSKKTYAMVTALIVNDDDTTSNMIANMVSAIKDTGTDVSATTIETVVAEKAEPSKGGEEREFGMDHGVSDIKNTIAKAIVEAMSVEELSTF